MTEETIIIEIDDSQLDIALIKLDLMGSLAKKTTGKKNLKQGLPGINREMRIILGQIPGMRQAIQLFLNIKRTQRGLKGIDVAMQTATFSGMLALVASLILLFRFLDERQKNIEREQKALRLFIMRERGVNKEGYTQLLSDWQKSLRGLPS